MQKEKLILEAKRIIKISNYTLQVIQAIELIRKFAGENSYFYQALKEPIYDTNEYKSRVVDVLQSYIDFIDNGLISNMSFEREVQIETVSDFLEQANSLLNDNKIHPSAPAVIIGAALEEFLRNWLEDINFDISLIKHSLDGYSQELKKLELINKQDIKDITSWGGIRNSAAHGRFDEVEDRNRIKLMLEGVNMFIRKYNYK